MDTFPYGQLVPLPAGFVPPEMWPEFCILAHPTTVCAREEVGTDPKGIRWSLWPITFEEYWADKEPRMTDSNRGLLARNRLVAWQRLQGGPAPKGWHALSSRPARVDGFYKLQPGHEYTADWSGNAKRNLKEWRTASAELSLRVEPLEFNEFKTAFFKSTASKKTGAEYIDVLERKLAMGAHKNCTLWGVRDNAGAIIGGYAGWYSPTYHSSTREFPFILPEARRCHAAVGLMDHWINQARANGAHMLVTTHFWQPGEPKSWKGFSAFKAQFGYTYVAYPPALWRFVRGKLF